MKKVLIAVGYASLGVAAYQLYMRQTKKARDENAADIFYFGLIGGAALALSTLKKFN